MSFESRLKQVRRFLKEKEIDCFLCVDSSDLFYLSGFKSSGCMGLISREEAVLFVPRLIFHQAREGVSSSLVKVNIINQEPEKEPLTTIKRKRFKYIGFDPQIPYRIYQEFKRALKGIMLISSPGSILKMRLVKDEQEQRLIRRSARIVCEAYHQAGILIQAGRTEREIAGLIELFMVRHGAQGASFPLMVARNRHSSFPHYISGHRKVARGDYVLIDIGCLYRGYASDLTRPLFLGKISKKWEGLYRLVLKAQKEAISRIQPGIQAKEVDLAARQVFRHAGLERYYIHNTGHGVGIDVHEPPTLSPYSREILKTGMVGTVESGIYLTGFGGMRKEDMILVTSKGHEVLTRTNDYYC